MPVRKRSQSAKRENKKTRKPTQQVIKIVAPKTWKKKGGRKPSEGRRQIGVGFGKEWAQSYTRAVNQTLGGMRKKKSILEANYATMNRRLMPNMYADEVREQIESRPDAIMGQKYTPWQEERKAAKERARQPPATGPRALGTPDLIPVAVPWDVEMNMPSLAPLDPQFGGAMPAPLVPSEQKRIYTFTPAPAVPPVFATTGMQTMADTQEVGTDYQTGFSVLEGARIRGITKPAPSYVTSEQQTIPERSTYASQTSPADYLFENITYAPKVAPTYTSSGNQTMADRVSFSTQTDSNGEGRVIEARQVPIPLNVDVPSIANPSPSRLAQLRRLGLDPGVVESKSSASKLAQLGRLGTVPEVAEAKTPSRVPVVEKKSAIAQSVAEEIKAAQMLGVQEGVEKLVQEINNVPGLREAIGVHVQSLREQKATQGAPVITPPRPPSAASSPPSSISASTTYESPERFARLLNPAPATPPAPSPVAPSPPKSVKSMGNLQRLLNPGTPPLPSPPKSDVPMVASPKEAIEEVVNEPEVVIVSPPRMPVKGSARRRINFSPYQIEGSPAYVKDSPAVQTPQKLDSPSQEESSSPWVDTLVIGGSAGGFKVVGSPQILGLAPQRFDSPSPVQAVAEPKSSPSPARVVAQSPAPSIASVTTVPPSPSEAPLYVNPRSSSELERVVERIKARELEAKSSADPGLVKQISEAGLKVSMERNQRRRKGKGVPRLIDLQGGYDENTAKALEEEEDQEDSDEDLAEDVGEGLLSKAEEEKMAAEMAKELKGKKQKTYVEVVSDIAAKIQEDVLKGKNIQSGMREEERKQNLKQAKEMEDMAKAGYLGDLKQIPLPPRIEEERTKIREHEESLIEGKETTLVETEKLQRELRVKAANDEKKLVKAKKRADLVSIPSAGAVEGGASLVAERELVPTTSLKRRESPVELSKKQPLKTSKIEEEELRGTQGLRLEASGQELRQRGGIQMGQLVDATTVDEVVPVAQVEPVAAEAAQEVAEELVNDEGAEEAAIIGPTGPMDDVDEDEDLNPQAQGLFSPGARSSERPKKVRGITGSSKKRR